MKVFLLYSEWIWQVMLIGVYNYIGTNMCFHFGFVNLYLITLGHVHEHVIDIKGIHYSQKETP